MRLNTNESPEPPPAAFLDDLAREVAGLAAHRYPDRKALRLRSALAEHHDVRPEQIFCGNGSNEVLQCLFLAYGGPGRSALVFEPTYALHSHIAGLTRTGVVALERSEDFSVSAESAARSCAELPAGCGEPALSLLCSPNNPTGNAEPNETLERLVARLPGLLVVDEAYAEFAGQTALDLVAANDNVVVVRTYSKTWALAALRLGYAVAHPEVVAALEEVALPYHLDAVKQAAGVLALGHLAEMGARVSRIVGERQRLTEALGELPLRVYPSDANFLLVRLEPGEAALVWKGLLERSVLVRNVSDFPGLEDCLRVTVGTPGENDRFLGALSEVLSVGKPSGAGRPTRAGLPLNAACSPSPRGP